MIRRYLWLYWFQIVSSAILVPNSWASTDQLDVMALEDLFKALNYPSQLKGWVLGGGDPCGESWTGVLCSGSSVSCLSLHGLGLSGTLGGQLHNMHNLKELDMSSNNIMGEIPSRLPTNATYLNLACNSLRQNIPDSLPSMRNLRHLNLSHNSLSGSIGNFFTELQDLREMDLSYNKFAGDLPSSFGSLKNLIGLFLQNNEFTGSVTFLSDLPLSHLNIQDNHFSGVVPYHFRTIPNLWMDGNRFPWRVDYPAWKSPMASLPNGENITHLPKSESSAIETYPPREVKGHKKKKSMRPGEAAFMICGGALLVTCTALFFVIRSNRSHAEKLRSLEGGNDTLPATKPREQSSSAPEEESPGSFHTRSPTMLAPRHGRVEKAYRKKRFQKKCKVASAAKVYSLSELESATNSFSEQKLIGEGSLGPVYKAEFPDGKVLAVKKIGMSPLSIHEEEQFLNAISSVSRLRHPNIVKLLGYCIEHGQHILVYEYVPSVSLHDALHDDAYKPLSWSLRLWTALGVARGLDYMHSTFSMPIAHRNVKAANILIDEELTPHLSDCGTAVLKPLTTNNVKMKASEIAIGDTGYIAPEHGRPGKDSTKADIYAFGVLLLELLTGRKPFDSSRPREEQSLVRWVSSRLHDSESLVDPSIRRAAPSSMVVSRFSDLASLCIQPVMDFRPPMSEVVGCLTSLLRKPGTGVARTFTSDSFDRSFWSAQSVDRSFWSAQSSFICSPTISH